MDGILIGWISTNFLTTSKTNYQGQQQGQMHSFLKLSSDNAAILPSYIIMKWSIDTVLYILQVLQVPSEHHVTSILITLAETIYNVLYKVWEPK